MARNIFILFIACVLLVCVRQNAAANSGCLNMNLNRLCRKHNTMRSEVEDIWAVIVTSGIQKQDYGNKTRTDDPAVNAQNVISKVDGTLSTIQGLKTEVEHLIVSSRNGFKHEKSWQREAIRNITKDCEDFKTDMTEKNIESKHHLERLDNRAAQLDQTCKNIKTRMENKIIKTEKKHDLINERISILLENLNATQNRLERENRDLKQTVGDMQENNQQKLNNIEKETRDLKQTISGMKENNQQKLNNIETENRELRSIIVEVRKDYQHMKQTLREVQNDNLKMKTELTKLQATILCGKDWDSFNDHCYLVVRQYKSWDDASAFCRSKNSYLLEITTDTEREFVTELLRDHVNPRHWFWSGATDKLSDKLGKFIYQHSQLPVPEKYWADGEPDNYSGYEHCVGMCCFTGSEGVELFDQICTKINWFVCEKPAA